MEIITIQEAANILKVSIPTVRAYIKEGLPYHQLSRGRRITFSKEQVLEWWKNNLSTKTIDQKISLLRRKYLEPIGKIKE